MGGGFPGLSYLQAMKPKCVSLKSVIDEFIRKGDACNPWKGASAEILQMWDKAAHEGLPQPFLNTEMVITEDA